MSLNGKANESGYPKPTETFDNFDTLGNRTLIEATTILTTLSQKIAEANGNLGIPLIVGLQGKPGTGKTHLLRAFQSTLVSIGAKVFSSKDTPYLFTQYQSKYNKTPGFILVIDDFLQQASSLDEAFLQNSKGGYELDKLPELLFDVYEQKGIIVVSSNFDIKDIINRVASKDSVGRLKSRVSEMMSSVRPIHIVASDYREHLAKQINPMKAIFNEAISSALEGIPKDPSYLDILLQDTSEYDVAAGLLSQKLSIHTLSDLKRNTNIFLTVCGIFGENVSKDNLQQIYKNLVFEYHHDKHLQGNRAMVLINLCKDILDRVFR